MINIAICDDSLIDLQYIKSIVEKWKNKTNLTCKISLFSSAENFLFNYSDFKEYDILLLDIEMKNMDGVTLAKTIRKDNKLVQIIFITGYSDYILDGYDVDALHYLMKPVNSDKLEQVLTKAVSLINKNEKCLKLTIYGQMYRIPLQEITHLEVIQNYVTIYSKEKYTIKKTLREIEKLLDDRFFRVSRSVIVNLHYISRVTKHEVVLNNGILLQLPRGMYDALNRAIISNT